MDAAKFADNLKSLLTKESVNDTDVKLYVKSLLHLSDLTKDIKSESGFRTFGDTVKQWIGAYQSIFSEEKMGETRDTVMHCIRKSIKILTGVFLNLMQVVVKHNPVYYQEFCYQWKLISSVIDGPRRAKYFCLFAQQFKSLIENLRTATHRCDQLAILAVSLMYIEHVPSDELYKLKQSYNSHIIDKLAVLKNQSTTMNQHAFLQDMNAMGHNIITLRPTSIICEKISLNLDNWANVLWIDFNMRDNSIALVGVSTVADTVTLLATLPNPKLTERLTHEHVIKIRGKWSVFQRGEGAIQKKVTIEVYLPIIDRNAVWKMKVKSIFDFQCDASISSQSMSQDQTSQVIDWRLENFQIDDGHNKFTSRNDESFTSWPFSSSRVSQHEIIDSSQILRNPIAPIAQKQSEYGDGFLRSTEHKNLPTNEFLQSKSIDKRTHQADDNFLDTVALSKDLTRNESLDKSPHQPDDDFFRPFPPSKDVTTKEWFEVNSTDKAAHKRSDLPIATELFDDNSSGVSFRFDTSVLDNDESKNEDDKTLERIETYSQGSWPSAVPVLNEHVQRFIEGPQSAQGEELPPTAALRETSFTGQSGYDAFQVMNQVATDRPPRTSTPRSSSGSRQNSSSKTLPPQIEDENEEEIYQPVVPLTAHLSVDSIRTTENANFLGDVPQKVNVAQLDVVSCNGPSSHEAVEDEKNGAHSGGDGGEIPEDLSINSNANSTELEIVDGMVCDDQGCVFVNDDEARDAFDVYVENNGLDYLKSQAFKSAPAERRKRSEREFRAIHKMINGKLERGTESVHFSNESIMRTARGTAKRSWNDSSVSVNQTMDESKEGSTNSYRNDTARSSGESICRKKATNSAELVSEVEPQLTTVIDYLADFLATHEICAVHQIHLTLLIDKLQNMYKVSSKSGKPLATTVTTIKAICEQARAYIHLLIQTANNQDKKGV